ncbi:MAG TPA: ABC transporter ATP-binding protein/permease [Erysipelotrichaceae bacterium]|nr:ABC transporter ATP-binding protein/permease [Erysipelotrichaceae bacterium]
MIKLTKVFKKYGERLVLDDVNLDFPFRGLCVIYGPSGSGKTTLLNCITGLTTYQGNIQVNHKNISSMSDDELSDLRLRTFGFVFQDFKLFETETVLRNLLFPLETLNSLSKNRKLRKCDDLLYLVGLTQKKKQIVNKLSGGEKQRVAIARALVNDPDIVLADEPTGALDEKNGNEIMSLIKKISQKSLVIMVSHDQNLTKKYADYIVEMDSGRVINITSKTSHTTEKSNLPISKNGLTNKKSKIPHSFLMSHTFHTMKQKKWRTALCYSMTSLGLVGVGLAFVLSSTVSNNIKQAYREIVDENALMVKLKNNETSINGRYAANYYEVGSLKEEYDEYVQDIGVTYYCNFESFFKDTNNLAIVKNGRYCIIPGFSARHINEYIWIDDLKTIVYPERIDDLENDEIILGLDYATLRELCFQLQIERTVKSLTDYLFRNDLFLYFDLENYDWTYSDQQLVKLVGFSLESDLKIYHSNHLWNEYMFEERMRFPISDAISQIDKNPWVMKKIYYLKTNEKRNELINLLIDDKNTDKFIFEIADETYYPWSYYLKDMNDRDRLLVFLNTQAHIPSWQIPYFLENDPNLISPIKGNNGGYLIYPESLMIGFAKTMYFANNQETLENIIDQQTSKSSLAFYQEELPPYVLSGNYVNSIQGGVKFNIVDENAIYGSSPKAVNEIVVSSSFIEALNLKDEPSTIYVTTPKKETLTAEGNLISDYVIVPLHITGVIKSNKNIIYQEPNWTTLFYQCEVGVSAFDLQTNTLAFSLNDSDKINESLNRFKKGFPQYEIINPLYDINESVNTVCFYLTIALFTFSSVATLIAIILLTICNYLYVMENKKEIALARCIGVNKKESRKFLYSHSLVQCLLSFVIASVELMVFTIIANLEIDNILSFGFSFSFDPIGFLPMLILSLAIALISSLVMSSNINKINPLEALAS